VRILTTKTAVSIGAAVEHSVLEIVELDNGEVVLQQAGSSGKPLLNIRFSDESQTYLETFGNLKLLVARAMIQAGVQVFSEFMQEQAEVDDTASEKSASVVLH